MQRLNIFACLLAGSLLLRALPADAAATVPYARVAWQQYPDMPAAAEQVLPERFPDWDESQLLSLGYREQQTYYHGSRGLVTSRFKRNAWVMILHYSSDGNCYIVQQAARITPRQQISYSVALPDGQEGITRVLFWSGLPDRQMAEALGAQLDAGLPLTGLLYEAWFPRSNRHESGQPYETEQFRVYENPPNFALTDIPATRAQLSTDYVAFTKDCCVLFDGRTAVGSDTWGARGEWVLSWGEELQLELYLPEQLLYTDAVLRLYITQSGQSGQPVGENIQLRVNDRDIFGATAGDSISVYPKHVDYELGQYIYPGLNVIKLKVDAFSTSDWLLQTAELWLR
ncbi:hypothetical protein KDL44_09750 [bacterium]|nr:hypothetical protein [bacterium]